VRQVTSNSGRSLPESWPERRAADPVAVTPLLSDQVRGRRPRLGGGTGDGRDRHEPGPVPSVNHYDVFFKLNLTVQEKNDLIQYLRGL